MDGFALRHETDGISSLNQDGRFLVGWTLYTMICIFLFF